MKELPRHRDSTFRAHIRRRDDFSFGHNDNGFDEETNPIFFSFVEQTIKHKALQSQQPLEVLSIGDNSFLSSSLEERGNSPFTLSALDDATTTIPYDNGLVDVAYSQGVMASLPPEQQERTLSEIMRVLAPWGVGIVDVSLDREQLYKEYPGLIKVAGEQRVALYRRDTQSHRLYRGIPDSNQSVLLLMKEPLDPNLPGLRNLRNRT